VPTTTKCMRGRCHRLFWALGFYADAGFRFAWNATTARRTRSRVPVTRRHEPTIAATIVRKSKGHKMYEVGKEDEGWSWKELETFNGRPSYEKDGLKLMAALRQS